MSQMFARGLLITPLDEDGRPLFTVDGNEVTFHRAGWYRFGTTTLSQQQLKVFAGAKVRHLAFAEDAQGDKRDGDLRTLLADLVDEEPCRLDHDGDCQEHNWFPGLADRPCPQERLRDHLGLDRQVNDDVDDEPSAEAMTSVHHSIALSWLQEGTLDLPALAAAIGMSVAQNTLHVRPTEQATITGPNGSWDTRTVEVPSHTRTQVVGPDGEFPAVWVRQYSGRNARIKVDRSHGLRGAINTEVWVYGSSDKVATTPVGTASLVGELRSEMLLKVEELREALRRNEVIDGDRARMLRDNQRLTARLMQERGQHAREIAGRTETILRLTRERDDAGRKNGEMFAEAQTTAANNTRHLEKLGRALHVEANRIQTVVRSWVIPMSEEQGADFYTLCDIMIKIRQLAINECFVPYEAPDDALDPNEGVPWRLREWAFLAREAMTSQANWVEEIIPMAGRGIEDGRVESVLKNAVKWLRQIAADYPEDVDAVGQQVNDRQNDDEAVRRLSHAMNEVANSLETRTGDQAFDYWSMTQVRPLVAKLRETVEAWTTEEQRGGAWRKVTSGHVVVGVDPATVHSDGGMAVGERSVDGLHVRVTNIHTGLPYPPDAVVSEPQLVNHEALKLARTMQAAATGIEAAYYPGKMPTIIRNIVRHLRADSAPWTSDALRAHEGEPAVADPENIPADLKDTSAAQGPHGAGGVGPVPQQVIVALRDTRELLKAMRGHEPPSLIPWASLARKRLTEALKLVES